jgi:hypothetical protein
MSAKNKTPGAEGFYIDKDGKKADANFHEPILEGISPEADKQHRLQSYHRAVEVHGIPPDRAAKLYGLEPSDIKIRPRR